MSRPALTAALLAPGPSEDRAVPGWASVLNLALATALLAGVITFALLQFDYAWDWSGVTGRWRLFVGGWLLTIAISALSLVLALVLGSAVALAHRSRVLLVRSAAQLYVEVIRGSPLLVQILFFWYVLFFGASGELRLPVGILVLALFSSAYLSEIIRSGLQSVGETQWESARAIGLTPAQTYRYVVVPQALRNILSPLVGQFANLIKDSSLLSIISIGEFTFQAMQIDANTFSPFEAYFPLAVGYLLLTVPISLASRLLERRSQFAS